MSRLKKIKKDRERKSAKVEMILLIEKAEAVFESKKNNSKSKDKANSYVRKARLLGMKYNLRFPRSVKRKFCKHCYSFLKPGFNCRIRTKNKKVIYSCLECGKFMRFVL